MVALRLLRQIVLIELIAISFLSLSENVEAFSAFASPDQGVEGALVIVSGKEWPPNDSVDISWPSVANLPVKNVPTDGNGSFTATIVVPKGARPGDSINVFNKGGENSLPSLTAALFTVLDKEPIGCFDAYFIGAHGTGEGPDGPNQTLSKVIGETWENFYDLAKGKGKKVRGYAIDYPADVWQVIVSQLIASGITTSPVVDLLPTVLGQGRFELNDRVNKVIDSCLTPRIVLAGYSLGAWVIDGWLDEFNLPAAIRAVELYGDPVWQRTGPPFLGGTPDTYRGVARVANLPGLPNPDPYEVIAPGSSNELSDRWQSRCLKDDPVCGEGYGLNSWLTQGAVFKDCLSTSSCAHKMYTKANGGHNLTERGANFLALKAFPDETGEFKIVYTETSVEGDHVYIRLYYTGSPTGFGFVGVNGAGWAREEISFSNPPPWTRLSAGRVDYPFNHACSSQPGNASDIEAWVYTDGTTPRESTHVSIHLACSAPKEVITPFFDH